MSPTTEVVIARRLVLVSAWICVALLACVSRNEELGAMMDGDDAGDDGAPADAPTEAATDGAPKDAMAPRGLEVECRSQPCYLSVSGNGSRHVCGLLGDGTVRCWGRDTERAVPRPGARGGGGCLPAGPYSPACVTNLVFR